MFWSDAKLLRPIEVKIKWSLEIFQQMPHGLVGSTKNVLERMILLPYSMRCQLSITDQIWATYRLLLGQLSDLCITIRPYLHLHEVTREDQLLVYRTSSSGYGCKFRNSATLDDPNRTPIHLSSTTTRMCCGSCANFTLSMWNLRDLPEREAAFMLWSAIRVYQLFEDIHRHELDGVWTLSHFLQNRFVRI
jgi:hypothetical protein